MSNEIFVRNPHSVLQAIKKRPTEVLEVSFPKGKLDGAWLEIEALVERHRIRVTTSERREPNKETSRRGNHHQKTPAANFLGRESGHGAMIRAKEGISIEKMLDGIDGSSRGTWLALDSLQDPQNLGAIFRSAAFFGIRGLILTVERSAPLTATVYDISSGGVETVPFVMAINLKQALDKAKEAGLWILGTSEHAKQSLDDIEKDRGWLAVMGNEEKGIRRLTEEACDVMCSIHPKSKAVTSLNVSVATGILLHHLS